MSTTTDTITSRAIDAVLRAPEQAPGYTCAEADAIADWITEGAGRHAAAAWLAHHAECDDDPADRHHAMHRRIHRGAPWADVLALALDYVTYRADVRAEGCDPA